MVRLRLLALFVFLSSFSLGQALVYTRVVKGNLWLPPGTAAPNSKMRFQLKYCGGQVGRVPVNPGNPPGPTGLVVSFEPFDVNVGNDGSWQTQIYGNDQIICGSDMSGPSLWLVQPVFNGAANAGIEYKIHSCGAASPCTPFVLDTAPQCSATVITDCAVENGNPDQPDTTVTVNAIMAVPNAYNFSNVLLPPANGTVINFMQNGNQAGAYLPGNGNASTCLSGTGTWVLCGGAGGGGGVTGATPNRGLVLTGTTLGLMTCPTTNQYLSWNGSAWVCTTLSGGGGSANLPTTAQYDLFASTGAGAAQASGLLGNAGFLRGEVFMATGDVSNISPGFPFVPNAAVEYFPTGGYGIGGANGVAFFSSHSGTTNAGGLALVGGNNQGVDQIYLDCEAPPVVPAKACDFKVPVTVNGAGVGGGGGGGLPTIPAPNLFASNGSGSAVDSGVLGQSGFLRAYVVEATGTNNPSPFTVPNGSIEYFPSGGYGAGGANGVALHVSHSGSATGFGGIALAGGNTTGVDQLYLDCEGPPVVPALGCDFKVPVTINGAAIGGGPGGGGVNAATVGQFASYNTTTTVAGNAHLSDNGTQITATEPIAAPEFITTTPNVGVSMTGSGGTLPTLASGTGGIGIGPGATPMMNLGTGAGWIAIPSSGGPGGGATLPACSATTPVNSCLVASNAAGTAGVDTHVLAAPAVGGSGAEGTGFIKSGASLVGGTAGGSSPFTGANASQEWYGVGGTVGTPPNNVTFANGAAMFMGHSGVTGIGGVAFGGGANTGTQQIYLDCESTPTPGCTFQVPIYEKTTLVAGTRSTTPNIFTNTVQVPQMNVDGSGGIAMTGAGATLPVIAAGSGGGIGIGPNGVPQMNVNGAGWINIPTSSSSGAATWGSITGTLSTQTDLQTALNGKLATNGTAATATALATTPTPCAAGEAAGGILANGNATGCFTPSPGVTNPLILGGVSSLGAVPSGSTAIGATTNGYLQMNYNGNGWRYVTSLSTTTAAGTTTAFTGPIANFIGSSNTTNPVPPANSRTIDWLAGNGAISGYLIGDGSQNCLNGQGTYVNCGVSGGGGVTGATGGGGLLLSGTTLGLTNTCTANQYLSYSGGNWICTSSGAGSVGAGTSGQFAVYNGTNSIVGSTVLTDGATVASTVPVTAPSFTGGQFIGQGTASVSPTAGIGSFGFAGGGVPAVSVGSTYRAIQIPQINSTYPSANTTTFALNGTNANPPVCNPLAPANGRCITFTGSQVGVTYNVSAALVGDGSANCLSGTGTYVPCGGVGQGNSGAFAFYPAFGNSIMGSSVLNDTLGTISSTEPFTAPEITLSPVAARMDTNGTTVNSTPSTLSGAFGFLNGAPAISKGPNQPFTAIGTTGGGVGGSGTAGFVPVFSAATTLANSHLDDGVTSPGTVTASESFAAQTQFGSVVLNPDLASIQLNDTVSTPYLNVDGNGGIGIGPSMSTELIQLNSIGTITSLGSAAPNRPPVGTGAFGFLAGGVPAISVNGGAFVPVPTTGGPGGGVGNGTLGQLAAYNSATTVAGADVFYSAGSTLPTLGAGMGGFGIAAGGIPQINSGNGWTRLISVFNAPSSTGVATNLSSTGITFTNSAGPGVPANALRVTVAAAQQTTANTYVGWWLQGTGTASASTCLSGTGAWVACGGAATTEYTCTISADVPFSTTRGTICSQALGATAKQWIVHCNIPWNFNGGSGTSNVVIGINLSVAPSLSPSYVLPVMWNTTGYSNQGAVQLNNAAGDTAIITANGLTAGVGGTIFSLMIDGTIPAQANTTFSIYGTTTGSGTAIFRPGLNCVLR